MKNDKKFKKFPKLLVPFYLICAALFLFTLSTSANFYDNERSVDNSLSAATWSATATATATEEPDSDSADVVINELMWMGSVGHSSDEWIELRNMSGSDINLAGWQITKNTGSESLMLTIASGTIPANGYYLISNDSESSTSSALNVTPNLVTSSVDLHNSKLQVKLYKGDWTNSANLEDVAGNGGTPLAGLNSTTNKESMSRKSTPGDGTQAANWQTDTTSNGLTFWDSADGNYGTPGGPNV